MGAGSIVAEKKPGQMADPLGTHNVMFWKKNAVFMLGHINRSGFGKMHR